MFIRIHENGSLARKGQVTLICQYFCAEGSLDIGESHYLDTFAWIFFILSFDWVTKNEGILDDKSRAHKENNKYFFNDEFDEALMTLLAFNLIVWSGCVCVCVCGCGCNWVWVCFVWLCLWVHLWEWASVGVIVNMGEEVWVGVAGSGRVRIWCARGKLFNWEVGTGFGCACLVS